MDLLARKSLLEFLFWQRQLFVYNYKGYIAEGEKVALENVLW